MAHMAVSTPCGSFLWAPLGQEPRSMMVFLTFGNSHIGLAVGYVTGPNLRVHVVIK